MRMLVKWGLLSLALLPSAAYAQVSISDPSFVVDHLYSGNGMVTLAFGPGGRMYVCEKQGRILVFQSDGLGGYQTPTVFADLTTEIDYTGESGLLGLTPDPDVATNRYFYLFYTYSSPTDAGQRVVRITADASFTTMVAGSETTLLNGLPRVSAHHKAGDIQFSPSDPNSIYVALGDDGNPTAVHDLNAYNGKILRINKTDGRGVVTNPYYAGDANAVRARIWAIGFRNPFRFAFHPTTPVLDVLYSSENGDSTDRMSFVRKGSDGDWNELGDADFLNPPDPNHKVLSTFSPFLIGIAVAHGGPFADPANPTSDTLLLARGSFGASVGEIRRWRLSGAELDTINAISADHGGAFATGITGYDMRFGPDGALYLSTTNTYQSLADASDSYELNRIRWVGGSPPVASFTMSPSPATGTAPFNVSFHDTSTDPDNSVVAWSWTFGDGSTSMLQNPTHTFTSPGSFTVTLTATDGSGHRASATGTVTVVAPVALSLTGRVYDGRDLLNNGLPQSTTLRLFQSDGVTALTFTGGGGTGGNEITVASGGTIASNINVQLTGPGVVVSAVSTGFQTATQGFTIPAGSSSYSKSLSFYLSSAALRGRVTDTRGAGARVDIGTARGSSLYAVAGGRDYLAGSGIPASGVNHRVESSDLGWFYIPIRAADTGSTFFFDVVADTNATVYTAVSFNTAIGSGAVVVHDVTVGRISGGTACDDLSLFNPVPNVDYVSYIQPIWNAQCTQCHSARGSANGGLTLEAPSFANIVDHISVEVPGMDLVEPGNLTRSFLFEKVNCTPQSGGRMQPGTPLTPSSQALIRDWIVQGARANVPPNPAPVLTSISPASVLVGAGSLLLTLNGSNFVGGATATYDGANLVTTYNSATQLNAQVNAAQITAGTHSVTVVNPLPGGGPSATLTFTVNNPAPVLTAISPTSANAGAADTTLTITGSGFVQGSSVRFGATALTTTYVSGAQLTAVIPAASMASGASVAVTVVNAAPGGGTTASITFNVNNPVPLLSMLSQTMAPTGSPGGVITMTGSSFIPTSQATFNNTNVATTYISSTSITARLTNAHTGTAGTFPMAVVNPGPGGGTSASIGFTIANNPVPVATSVSPNSVVAGAAATQVTVTGSQFSYSTYIAFDGVQQTTTQVSGTQLRATIAATSLAAAGTHSITLVTPAPGGGTSASLTFTVTAPASTISVAPTSLTYSASEGGANPASQTLSVSNSGGGTLSVNAVGDQGWLSVSPASGTAPVTLTISVSVAGLSPGPYFGNVVISSSSASNSPQLIPVTLTINAVSTLASSPTSLSFSATQGANPASQNLSVTSGSGGALTFNTASDAAWLSATPSSATTPATIAVSANTAGLAAGTFTGHITLSSASATNSPLSVTVTLTVTAAPRALAASPTSLSFSMTTGGANPAAQALSITDSTGAASAYTTSSNASWLTASPSSGTTPSSINISANSAGLAVGTYSGAITLSSASATSVTVPVVFTIASAGTQGLTNGGFEGSIAPWGMGGVVTYVANGSSPHGGTGYVTIGSAASSSAVLAQVVNVPAGIQAATLSLWVRITTAETTTTMANDTVQVNIRNSSGALLRTLQTFSNLDAASHASYVQHSYDLGTTYANTAIRVTFDCSMNSSLLSTFYIDDVSVLTGSPTIGFAPASIAMSANAGASTAATLAVSNTGVGAFSYTLSSNATWLTASPTSGSSATNVTLTANSAGLATGTYNGTITISATGATNTPQTVPVSFTVAAAPSIVASPTSVSFSGVTGAANPASQSVSISNGGSGTLSYTASSNATWLSVSPASGTAPSSVTLTANTAGLATGTYNANLTIAATGATNTPQTVPVTLTLTAPPTISLSSTSYSFSGTAGGTNPASQSLTISNTGGGTLSWTTSSNQTWLTASAASGTAPSTITLSASLTGLAAGTYTGAITVSATGASNTPQTVNVTLTVYSQLIANGGFEGGTVAPWGRSGSGATYSASGGTPRTGTGYVYFGGVDNSSGLLAQQFTIPTGATSVTLTYYIRITTNETTTTLQNDLLTVKLQNAAGATLTTFATYSNLDAPAHASYTLKTFNLAAWAGQSVRLTFESSANGSLPTTFSVDDVSVLSR